MQEPDHGSSDPQGYENEQVPFSYELDEPGKEPVTQRPDGPFALQSDVQAEPGQREHSVMSTGVAPPRRRWRSSWAALISVFAVLLICLLSVSTYLYMNRSTPLKTLDSFCTALQHEDYPQAYNAFSPKLQNIMSESRFTGFFVQDRVILCTHGTVDDSSSSVTTALKLVHASAQVNNDMVTLAKDATDTWKISDVRRA